MTFTHSPAEAQAALAWHLAQLGHTDEARRRAQAARLAAAGLPRRNRHVVEILALLAEDRIARATGLAHEHLAEHSDDRLVQAILDRIRRSNASHQARDKQTDPPARDHAVEPGEASSYPPDRPATRAGGVTTGGVSS